MKIIWITNTFLPEVSAIMTGEKELKSSGGWMIGAANALINNKNIELTIATVHSCVDKLTNVKGSRISYYIIPYGKGNEKYNSEYEKYWQIIYKNVNPDIVHIHGTEFSHGLAYVNVCGSKNVVVSIQGLKSAIAPYYLFGIRYSDIIKYITFHDILKGSLLSEKNRFKKSGKYEFELLKKVTHIIGRTSWDRARTWAINPNADYHFCNETLREEFYDGSIWNYSSCNKHSIFLSQAGYPIKGFHQVLKAIPLILREFPDTTIRVAGEDITRSNGIKGILHYTGYGKYLKRLIRKYHFEEAVTFVGNLNAQQMKQEYLKANLFICPSSIENSPNSLGEAQILGVPCIASYVGGVMDMMKGNEQNLYRFEEFEMLAYRICEVFKSHVYQVDMRSVANYRHDAQGNADCLFNIYKRIAK